MQSIFSSAARRPEAGCGRSPNAAAVSTKWIGLNRHHALLTMVFDARRPGRIGERGKEKGAKRWGLPCREARWRIVGRAAARRQYSDTSTVAWPKPSRGGIARESAHHGDHEESMIGDSVLGTRGSNSTTTMRPPWHCGHSRNVQPVSASARVIKRTTTAGSRRRADRDTGP